MKKECKYCKHYVGIPRLMLNGCQIHPYYGRNNNYDCKDFKWIRWLFFMKYFVIVLLFCMSIAYADHQVFPPYVHKGSAYSPGTPHSTFPQYNYSKHKVEIPYHSKKYNMSNGSCYIILTDGTKHFVKNSYCK